jgi:hypothetical protein
MPEEDFNASLCEEALRQAPATALDGLVEPMMWLEMQNRQQSAVKREANMAAYMEQRQLFQEREAARQHHEEQEQEKARHGTLEAQQQQQRFDDSVAATAEMFQAHATEKNQAMASLKVLTTASVRGGEIDGSADIDLATAISLDVASVTGQADGLLALPPCEPLGMEGDEAGSTSGEAGQPDEGPVAALPCSGNGAIAEIHKERGTAMMAMQRKVERKRAACATKIQACERGRRARLLGAGQAMKPATREAERAVGA